MHLSGSPSLMIPTLNSIYGRFHTMVPRHVIIITIFRFKIKSSIVIYTHLLVIMSGLSKLAVATFIAVITSLLKEVLHW